MTSPILLLAGRFLLASALLMALYWVVWHKQATYRAKRMYLLTIPIVALAISLIQVEVYKPGPMVVEVMSEASEPTSPSPSGPSPIPSQGRGVDTPSGIDLPMEKMADFGIVSEPSSIEEEANSSTLFEGQDISLPPLGESKGWGPGLGLLYALIVLVLCIPFVVNLVLVRRLRKEASIVAEEKETNIRILTGEGVQAPFSFHRTIFLPANLTETQHRMILAHERAHILHRHYVDAWVAEAVTRLLWFNPFLWWARQELRNVHEFEADSNVLATGEDVYAYQAILIEEVLHGDIVIANGFNHSFIRCRFIEMLQSTNLRMTSPAKAVTAAWLLLVVVLMCCTVGEAETMYKVKEQRPLPSLPKGEGVDSHATSEQQDITHPSPIKEQQEEAVPADSRQWHQAKAIGPQEFILQAFPQLKNIPELEALGSAKNGEPTAIDTTYAAQNRLLLQFIANWFELSENAVHLSEKEHEEMHKKIAPHLTYEEYTESWGFMTIYNLAQMKEALKGMNNDIRIQVEALLKQHGWTLPRDKHFHMTIKSEGFNKTWTFVKEPYNSGISLGSFTKEEIKQMKADAKKRNESSITDDASLREQDEALQAFFSGWFDMNKMSQKPVMTEKEFQQALKTEPIPLGAIIPTYEEYKEIRANRLKAVLLKMEDGRTRLNSEIRPQVEAVLKQHGKFFPPERQLKIVIKADYKNATWEFENNTLPNSYGYALSTNFEIADDPSSPGHQ